MEKKLLLTGLIERVIKTHVVAEVPRISKASAVENKGAWFVQTEGMNFERIWEMKQFVDVNKLYCNDVYSLLQLYGKIKICCSSSPFNQVSFLKELKQPERQ